VPGARSTSAQGINDAGQIVGFFIDSTGNHGFLDTGGSFTTIDVPGTSFTIANGINDAGQIVGTFESSFAVEHGFLATPVSVVPEPSSLALFSVGVIVLRIVRRR
jgi:probable HAF family extracellular repeat protein